jgi:uncharacterized protein
MTPQNLPSDAGGVATGRSRSVDALRGFALFGIIIVNAPFFAGPLASAAPENLPDVIAVWATGAFATGKFFLVFSLLFGFGFAVATGRDKTDGRSLRWRFMRRMLGLFVFGALHACLLFFGDILMLYAVLGIVLWLCRNWTIRGLLTVSGAIYLLAVLVQAGVMYAANNDPAVNNPGSIVAGSGYLGGFVDVTRARLAELPLTLGFVLLFNGLPALAMFLLGLAAGKAGFLPPKPDLLAKWRLPESVSFLAAAAGSGLCMAVVMVSPAGLAGLAATVGLCVVAPFLSIGLAGLCIRFAESNVDSRLVRWLAVAGASSLSGYILHSIILGAIFYGWGLGYYGMIGPAAVLAIGCATFLVLVAFLNIWRSRFRYGPDEWLLRSFAELRWKPLLHG